MEEGKQKIDKELFDAVMLYSKMYKLETPYKVEKKEDLLNMARTLYKEIFSDIIDTQREFQLFVSIMRIYARYTEKDPFIDRKDLDDIQLYMVKFANIGPCELNNEIFPKIIKNLT